MAENERLFVQFLEQKRKYFAAKRSKEKRNRPPTRAQQRSIMCTYLKNMEGWKPKSLKNKSFANIQGLVYKGNEKENNYVTTELSCRKIPSSAKTRRRKKSKKAKGRIAQEVSFTLTVPSIVECKRSVHYEIYALQQFQDKILNKPSYDIKALEVIVLVSWSSALLGKMSPLVAVVALHLGLIKPNGLIIIYSKLPSSVLQELLAPHQSTLPICHLKSISSKSSGWSGCNISLSAGSSNFMSRINYFISAARVIRGYKSHISNSPGLSMGTMDAATICADSESISSSKENLYIQKGSSYSKLLNKL
ncbi:hypothetical protein Tco_1429194 [Tanacetum coccineum]